MKVLAGISQLIDFVKRLQDRPDTVGSRQYTRVLALAGGLPIKVDAEIVGAVSISGTPGKETTAGSLHGKRGLARPTKGTGK